MRTSIIRQRAQCPCIRYGIGCVCALQARDSIPRIGHEFGTTVEAVAGTAKWVEIIIKE